MNKAKGFFAEFKEFASRGNVVDMAVGVIIGSAFKAIVDSLVQDVVMPFVGLFVNTSSFSNVVLHLGSAEILIGNFLAAVLNFLIIAFVIFCMVKLLNKAHARMSNQAAAGPAPEEPAAPTTEELLAQILDELKNRLFDVLLVRPNIKKRRSYSASPLFYAFFCALRSAILAS